MNLVSIMDVTLNYYACRICHTPTGREVNGQYDSEYCPMTSTPGNIMDNISRCQLVLGSPKTAARAVFDAKKSYISTAGQLPHFSRVQRKFKPWHVRENFMEIHATHINAYSARASRIATFNLLVLCTTITYCW